MSERACRREEHGGKYSDGSFDLRQDLPHMHSLRIRILIVLTWYSLLRLLIR